MMRESLAHGFWLLVAAAIGGASYIALLVSGLLGDMSVLFYRGLVLAIVAGMIAAIVGALIARWRDTPPLAFASAITCFAMCLSFLVLFPVTIDRSVSVYLLATIAQQGDAGMTPAALETAFVDGYVGDMDAIDRRIAEQQLSGNVSVDADGKVRLTARGSRFVALSRWAAAWLGTDPRFVAGHPPRNAATVERGRGVSHRRPRRRH